MSRFFKSWRAGNDGRSGEREAHHLLPRQAFADTAARSLRLLRGLHVPVTLFAVRLPPGVIAEAEACVSAILQPFGAVGRLPDGRIGLLYLGPHSPGRAGERTLATHLLARIARRLGERGWEAMSRGVELSAAHAWADAIQQPAELLRALGEHSTPHRMARPGSDAAVEPGCDAHLSSARPPQM